MLHRRHMRVLGLVLALGSLLPLCRAAAQSKPLRPNLILIVADDLGYECIGANGGTSYKTPVLDRLAATGVRFDHCYAQPLCTPTRLQLMTGLYNVRNYVDFGETDPKAVTFGNVLKQAGYATCIAGKWQLGRNPEQPKEYGFDEHCLWQHLRRPLRYKNAGLEINGKAVDFTNGEYGPDVVNQFALDFIQRKKDQPFFLYYPMMLTHSPFEPTPDSPGYDAYVPKNGAGGARASERHFGGMVSYMDKLVGRVTAKLDELKLRDNTLVLFVGDNGTGAGVRSLMGEKVVMGGKGRTMETGMHVPFIASWPGKVAVGKVCTDLVDTTDFLPTLCEAARVTVPAGVGTDGRSFLPQLRGERGKPREWYYSWYAPRGKLVGEFAATKRYKLYRTGELFDVAQDAEEEHALPAEGRSREALDAVKLLTGVLEKYKNARPGHLPTPPPAPRSRASEN
jgi:arylsulfatase A